MDHCPWIWVPQEGKLTGMKRTLAQATGRTAYDVRLVSRETRRLVRLSGATPSIRATESIHPVALSAMATARAQRV